MVYLYNLISLQEAHLSHCFLTNDRGSSLLRRGLFCFLRRGWFALRRRFYSLPKRLICPPKKVILSWKLYHLLKILANFARFGKFLNEALKTFCPHADDSIQPTKTVVDHTFKLIAIHVQNTYQIIKSSSWMCMASMKIIKRERDHHEIRQILVLVSVYQIDIL